MGQVGPREGQGREGLVQEGIERPVLGLLVEPAKEAQLRKNPICLDLPLFGLGLPSFNVKS
jgi:hypothetical protein